MKPPFTKRSPLLPLQPQDPKPKKPRTLEVRAVSMPGKTLTSRLIKPVGAALLLLTTLAHATTTVVGAPQGGAPANVPEVCAALTFLGQANVFCPPTNAEGNGVADDTAALNRAALALSATGGTIALPPGTYRLTGRVGLYSGQVLAGAGCSFDGVQWRGTVLQMTGTPGYAGIGSATPATCAGGAGSCAATVGAGTKGAGCACYVNGDCTSGVCANGTSVRGVVIRNLCVQIQVDHSVGIDLTGINEADVSDLFVFADAPGATDVTGVLLSDVNGAFSGYSNSVHNLRLGGTGGGQVLTVGVRVLPQANNTTLREIRIQGNTATGIQTDDDAAPFTVGQPALNTHIQNNAIETFSTQAILDRAKGTQISGNYCESGGSLALACLALKDSTSVQIGYNFFTPSTLSNPVQFSGVTTTPVQLNNESNMTDTAKWTNTWSNFDFSDYSYQPKGAATFSCNAGSVGRVYYNNVQHSLCRCDTFGGTLKWCPVSCDTSPACTGAFVCGAGQTASTCG